MDDWQSIKFIITAYFILIISSRAIHYILGTYLIDANVMAEFVTFIIVYLLDVVALYVVVKLAHIGGIAATFMLAIINAFPFALFYVLGVYMIYYVIWVVTNIINFIMM